MIKISRNDNDSNNINLIITKERKNNFSKIKKTCLFKL